MITINGVEMDDGVDEPNMKPLSDQDVYLLACPFCGLPGEYTDISIRDEDWLAANSDECRNGDWWLAGCANCGIWLPQCEWATKQQAADAWNKRHDEKAT